MQTNTTKAKLKAGEPVIGCITRTPDAGLIEFLGFLGWDFLVFDGEHGTIDPHHCEHLVRAAELRGVTPIVRATTNQPHVILRYMDTGAHGLHVPWVNSGPEAEAVIRAVKYTPRGQRGLAWVRAAGYGQPGPLGDYVEQANRETLTVVHIETMEAVANIADILAVPDLDVVFVGQTDLSQSLGHPGNPAHPDVQAAVDRVFKAAVGSAVAVGTIAPTGQATRRWIERGARYVIVTLESILGPACRDFLRAARGEA